MFAKLSPVVLLSVFLQLKGYLDLLDLRFSILLALMLVLAGTAEQE